MTSSLYIFWRLQNTKVKYEGNTIAINGSPYITADDAAENKKIISLLVNNDIIVFHPPNYVKALYTL